jgi:hypothetical protein
MRQRCIRLPKYKRVIHSHDIPLRQGTYSGPKSKTCEKIALTHSPSPLTRAAVITSVLNSGCQGARNNMPQGTYRLSRVQASVVSALWACFGTSIRTGVPDDEGRPKVSMVEHKRRKDTAKDQYSLMASGNHGRLSTHSAFSARVGTKRCNCRHT